MNRYELDTLELGEYAAAEFAGQNAENRQPYDPTPLSWIKALAYFANPRRDESGRFFAREGWGRYVVDESGAKGYFIDPALEGVAI